PAQARDRGQPQAGAAGDSRAEADPAPAAAGAAQAARLLPGRAAAAALAARHVERLGRRARLDVLGGDHRLLHPRDRRLAARAALPRRRSDRADGTRRRKSTTSSRVSSRSEPTTAPPSPPAAFVPRSSSSASATDGRLPRPREAGLHREVVREAERTGGVGGRGCFACRALGKALPRTRGCGESGVLAEGGASREPLGSAA